jgi:serine protease Do
VRLAPFALAAVLALPLAVAPPPSPAAAQQIAPQIPPPGAPSSFAPLAQRLLPAVVNIQVTQAAGQPRAGREAPDVPQAPPGSPFEEFFRDFLERNRPQGPQGPRGEQGQPNRPQQPQRRAQSLGSGFIIDPSGVVVTNNHVIEGADEITVVMQDGTSLRATLVGADPRTDLAVLRVTSERPLPSVPFGDSDTAQVGDWVVAIGNPFGLGGSVTAGIVSARGRDIRQGLYDDFIQTDAAINRGNSGGPLFNLAGEVVGINTAIYSPTGGSIGIGFSIPSNLARNVTAQLREHGRVRRGWLGVNIQQVTDEIAESLGLRGARGALVARAQEGGPAAAGGIQAGDVILRFNNAEVREMRNLPRIVADTNVGSQVPVVVWRDGREQTVTITVAELPAEQQQAAVQPNQPTPRPQQTDLAGLGLRVAPITPEARERFSLRAETRGVVITEVAPGSPGAERELRPGDVIVEVQQERVNTPQEVQERIERLRRQNRATALLLIESAQGQRWVPLRLNAPQRGTPG